MFIWQKHRSCGYMENYTGGDILETGTMVIIPRKEDIDLDLGCVEKWKK